MSSDVYLAEQALHHRMRLACSAAMRAGLPGEFLAGEQAGLLTVLATNPALAFLRTVTGITEHTVAPAIDLLRTGTTLVASAQLAPRLRAAGLTPVGDRPLAIHRLSSPVLADQDVIPAGEDFADLLVAGYEVDGVIAEFIRAEHRSPAVHRFQLLDGSGPIAAAAMTIHGEVAVLGGASTLPAYRGRGAQSRLLRHRLSVAATEGCVLAVATASAGSVSAANLRKAGFELHHRQAWTMTNDADTAEL